MTTFLLIRHGHTDWIGKALAGHIPGVSLSAEGREQAERLTYRLRNLPLRAIYSSPLDRTIQTAEPLARAFQLHIHARPRLTEINFGQWAGRSMEDLDKDPLWHRFNTLRSVTRAPGGELMLEVQARMTDELEGLCLTHLNETVAIVSHQDTIKAALAHYAGIPLDHLHRFEIWPASVSVLQIASWGARVITINNMGEF